MVTGNSTADLTIVLVDARKGIVEQTRRHAFLASLLRVPHLLVCVNKMDLVDYDQAVFDAIREEFAAFASRLEVADLSFIPISALKGDNVVQRSANMPWYEGASLLLHLGGRCTSRSDRSTVDPRMPVQWVVRPTASTVPDFRGLRGGSWAGSSGPGTRSWCCRLGTHLHHRRHRHLRRGPVEEAFAPMSVMMVRLAEDLDVSRRPHLPAAPEDSPTVGQDITDAMLCWMADRPLGEGNDVQSR